MTRARLIAVSVVVTVLVATGAFLAGRLGVDTATPARGSAAAGFLRDMQTHHAQAVDMAMTIRDSTADPEIRRIAYDIALGQSNQAGQMYGLLESWGLPQASDQPPMTWMSQPVLDGSSGDHAQGMAAGGPMPGMASEAEIAQLRNESGVEADRLFLTLMIAHHRGGLEMAEGILARTTVPQVVTMAKAIIATQTADIDAMQAMLDAR